MGEPSTLREIVDAEFSESVTQSILAAFIAGFGVGETFTEDDAAKVVDLARASWLESRLWLLVRRGTMVVGLDEKREPKFAAATDEQKRRIADLCRHMAASDA